MLCLDLCLVLEHSSLLLLFLLESVLLALTFSASEAFGSKSLITKCSPRPEVLAALAPFDLEPVVTDHPDVDIT